MIDENIVSLSGGKDSTAMLLMMLEKGMRVDEVLFFDTGMEFPQMYDHLERVEKDTGLTITRITGSETFEHGLLEHRRTRGKRINEVGFGWPTPMARWCTALKVRAIEKHLKGREVAQFVGIAADEARRCKKGINYPLVDWGVTESDALAYCRARGYDWGGLYDHFKRVSCWCCPLQSIDELRKLRKYHPDLWKKLIMLDMDVNLRPRVQTRFRADYSLPQIEQRFRNEDAQRKLFDEMEEA